MSESFLVSLSRAVVWASSREASYKPARQILRQRCRVTAAPAQTLIGARTLIDTVKPPTSCTMLMAAREVSEKPV